MRGLIEKTSFVQGFTGATVAAVATSVQEFTTERNRGSIYGVAMFVTTTSLDEAALMTCGLQVNGQDVIGSTNGQKFYYNNNGRPLFYPVKAGGGSVLTYTQSGATTGNTVMEIIVLYREDKTSMVQNMPIIPPDNKNLTLKNKGFSGALAGTTTVKTQVIDDILPIAYGTAKGFNIVVGSTLAVAIDTRISVTMNGIEFIRNINGALFYASAEPKMNFFPFPLAPSAPFQLNGTNANASAITLGIEFRYT